MPFNKHVATGLLTIFAVCIAGVVGYIVAENIHVRETVIIVTIIAVSIICVCICKIEWSSDLEDPENIVIFHSPSLHIDIPPRENNSIKELY